MERFLDTVSSWFWFLYGDGTPKIGVSPRFNIPGGGWHLKSNSTSNSTPMLVHLVVTNQIAMRYNIPPPGDFSSFHIAATTTAVCNSNRPTLTIRVDLR